MVTAESLLKQFQRTQKFYIFMAVFLLLLAYPLAYSGGKNLYQQTVYKIQPRLHENSNFIVTTEEGKILKERLVTAGTTVQLSMKMMAKTAALFIFLLFFSLGLTFLTFWQTNRKYLNFWQTSKN